MKMRTLSLQAIVHSVLHLPFGFMLLFSVTSSASADVVDLGTLDNTADWLVTGAGANEATPFQTSANVPGEISITSNAFRTGTFIDGATLAEFNGFWYADNSFFIPTGATDIKLDFDSLYGNDRVVLQLNGVSIGNADHLGATGVGLMSFPPGPPDVQFTFTGNTSASVTSGFIIGGQNTLRLIVNNTGLVPITAPTATFGSDGDATNARVVAELSFTVVPEPTSLSCVLTAALCAGLFRMRKQCLAFSVASHE